MTDLETLPYLSNCAKTRMKWFLKIFWRFLPPATKLGQSYVFTCVCDSVNRGVSAPLHAGIHPPPPSLGPEAGTPLGTDPLPSGSRHPQPGPAPPRRRSRPLTGADTPSTVHAGRYGQHAGGMDPTRMQSCWYYVSTEEMPTLVSVYDLLFFFWQDSVAIVIVVVVEFCFLET